MKKTLDKKGFVALKLGLIFSLASLITNCNNYALLDKIENPGGSNSQETFTNNYYIFVSSWTTLGAMGGSPYNADCGSATGDARADCACTRAAISRGLRRSSTHVFRAWLSTTSANAICRVQGQGNACTFNFPFPWFNTQGQTVVSNYNGLANTTLSTAVRYDEFGADQGPNLAWTGTLVSGIVAGNTCGNWLDNTAGSNGQVGDRTQFSTANLWTDNSAPMACNTSQRIYCVAAP